MAASPLARGGTLALDAAAEYRGSSVSGPTETVRQDLFAERVGAAWEAVLSERAIGSYYLGFALEHRDTFGLDEGKFFDYEYDARLNLWEDGVLPLRLFALRDSWTINSVTRPGQRQTNRVLGMDARLAIPELPRFRVQATDIHTEVEGDGQSWIRSDRDVTVGLVHVAGPLSVMGEVERRRQIEGDEIDRLTLDGRMSTAYQVNDDVSVHADGFSRRYDTTVDGVTTQIGVQSGQAFARYRVSPEVMGISYYRVQQTSLPDSLIGDWSLGSNVSWTASSKLLLQGDVGVDSAWTSFDRDVTGFHGEHARLASAYVSRWHDLTYRLSAEAGLALLTDKDLGSGLQSAARVGLDGSTPFGGRRFMAYSAVSLGGQVDASPRDQDYASLESLVGVESLPVHGFTSRLEALENVIVQTSADTGSSHRTEVRAEVGQSSSKYLGALYRLSVGRNQLDDAVVTNVSHSVHLASNPTINVGFDVVAFHETYNTIGLGRLVSNRVEAIGRQKFGSYALQERVSYQHQGGRVLPYGESQVWVELSRGARWDL